jgi:DNA repair exonuclease SbcCD ATPase subunit
MKLIQLLVVFAIITVSVNSQTIRFNNQSDVTKVYNGQTVKIEVDTAYVIGKTKAQFINQKIEELNQIKFIYNNMAENHNRLLIDLSKLQELLEKLKEKTITDSVAISSNFKQLLTQLDISLNELKVNNEQLKKNNSELETQISKLEKIIKQLRKEARGIWWNGVADKLVAFAGGVGVGVLLVKVL